jgi:hypothetical protein
MTDLLAIKEAVYEVGLLFNQSPDDAKITAYAKALQNYSPKQIVFAFNQVILSGTAFFPSLAEVLDHLRPKETPVNDRANLIMEEVIKKIQEFSEWQEDRMREAMSPEALEVIKLMGGTYYIRNAELNGTLKAQIRDTAKGVLSFKESTKKMEQLQKIGLGNVLQMPSPEMRTMDYSGFLPKSEA